MDENPSNNPLKVLVVDDEEGILRTIKRLLMDEPLEVLTAMSGEEALKIIKSQRDIALIVSDQRMPGMKGVELLREAKQIAPETLRIMLTGYADINATIETINQAGVYRYITKPWKDTEFLQTIKEAVQQYALIQENKRLTEMVKRQNEEMRKWNDELQYFVQEQTIEIQNKNKELQKLNEKLKNNFKNSIKAFSSLTELRDRGTTNHSKNVAGLAKKMAVRIGFSGEEVETIFVASLLHDIGKIGIPDVLLLKDPEEMNPEERKVYQLHPILGQTAVDSVEELRGAGVLIRHHHEWLNGMGFPGELKGTDIPLGSAIIGMADFVDRVFWNCKFENALDLTLAKTKGELGKRFDHKLFSPLKESLEEIYSYLSPKTDAIEMELYPPNLRPGMVVSRDVRSGTGLLLLSRGIHLNEDNIQALKRYYQIDPSKSGVFVWVRE